MAEEPGHKAMLFFLEVLMNSDGPLTISQLAGRFGSRTFTAEMRQASGSNEAGLKKFLLKYPSLFTVTGNMVSLFDSSKGPSTPSSTSSAGLGSGGSERDTSHSVSASRRSLPDVSAEMEAVQYFQDKLIKKEEKWVQIKSLAGHLSQASEPTRRVVGPQLDFRAWLIRHPHIFEVQGELVGLREGIAALAASPPNRRSFYGESTNGLSFDSATKLPPRTPPPSRRAPPKTPPAMRRSHSFSEKRAQALLAQSVEASAPPSNTPVMRRKGAPITMTANEYKAVMFLKDIIEKRGPLQLHSITGHFSQAAEGIRNTIGWTKAELDDFLRNNASIFYVSEDERVDVVKNAKLNVIITGSRPANQANRTLTGRKGKIFHVAKLWGIIDLGKHEHVFFDKSIMKRPIDDLQREYKIGDTLHFNAVLAPKNSRAKWRAIHVWKEHEVEPVHVDSVDGYSSGNSIGMLSPSHSIEEEINELLVREDDKFSDHSHDDSSMENQHFVIESRSSSYSDLRLNLPDYAIPLPYEETVQMRHKDPEMIIQKPYTQEKRVVIGDAHPTSNLHKSPLSKSTSELRATAPPFDRYKKMVDSSTQTVSTGDIIATQLYHDDDAK